MGEDRAGSNCAAPSAQLSTPSPQRQGPLQKGASWARTPAAVIPEAMLRRDSLLCPVPHNSSTTRHTWEFGQPCLRSGTNQKGARLLPIKQGFVSMTCTGHCHQWPSLLLMKDHPLQLSLGRHFNVLCITLVISCLMKGLFDNVPADHTDGSIDYSHWDKCHQACVSLQSIPYVSAVLGPGAGHLRSGQGVAGCGHALCI